MDWKHLLIDLYFKVCEAFENQMYLHTQRHNKNAASMSLSFTDQEAITVYLFGVLRKQKTSKGIYTYTHDHLSDWFPTLPSYQKFNERLNRLNGALAAIAQYMSRRVALPDWLEGQSLVDAVVDSFPIILAKGARADGAKVAREVADKGYCSSKNLWYHGIKLHKLGLQVPGKLPLPQSLVMSAASQNDNTVFKEQIAPAYRNLRVYGDKIFHDQPAIEHLKQEYNIEMMPCQKRKKGQPYLHADQKFFNTLVSKARQPVESFFNWLEEKTGIQCAAKVRSTQGLFKQVCGALAAALFTLAF